MVENIKRRWHCRPNWLKWPREVSRTVLAVFCGLIIGLAGVVIIGKTQTEFWIIYGGNTDPGDGQGGGAARDQLIAGGWTDEAHSYQVQWKADISQGTKQETDAAMPAGHQAFDAHCHVNRCIIAGFSLGNSPALELSAQVGQPAELTYLFGAPQPSTGVWHSWAPDNPTVAPWIEDAGQLSESRPTAPGMQAFYDTHDPYANAAPQCSGPGLFALSVNPGHRIIAKAEADAHVWTGPDGVVMHEAAYAGPQGLPASGADPSLPWAGCPASGWYNQSGEIAAPVPEPVPAGPSGVAPPVAPGGGPNGTPGTPSAPSLPGGIPGGSPIPSANGNMPPALPGLPGAPQP